MCKKCCVNQSLDDTGESVDIERFKNTLYFNDKPYRTELHRACISQAEKRYSDEGGKTKAETIVGLYFGKLSILHQYKNMTWDDRILQLNYYNTGGLKGLHAKVSRITITIIFHFVRSFSIVERGRLCYNGYTVPRSGSLVGCYPVALSGRLG